VLKLGYACTSANNGGTKHLVALILGAQRLLTQLQLVEKLFKNITKSFAAVLLVVAYRREGRVGPVMIVLPPVGFGDKMVGKLTIRLLEGIVDINV
jgi:hypothetical protein